MVENKKNNTQTTEATGTEQGSAHAGSTRPSRPSHEGGKMLLTVSSSAFREGQAIPAKFAGNGPSPPLSWTNTTGAKAWAIIVEDPDAPGGTWTHWTAWNLPESARSLPEGADIKALGGVLGITSAKTTGYHGPAPPSGTHRYFFRVYGLSAPLTLPEKASVQQLKAALSDAAIAEGQLMGKYSK